MVRGYQLEGKNKSTMKNCLLIFLALYQRSSIGEYGICDLAEDLTIEPDPPVDAPVSPCRWLILNTPHR